MDDETGIAIATILGAYAAIFFIFYFNLNF